MRKFTKTVTKEIENIYKEFEDLLVDCIHNAEYSCYDNDFSKNSELTVFKIIRNNQFLEREFEEAINSLKIHLVEQLKTFTPMFLVYFIEKQNENYFNYLPDVRKTINYKNYLQIIVASGDTSILDQEFKPSEENIEYLKYIFGIYQFYYEKLKLESGLLFEKYKEIISKNCTIENEVVIKPNFHSIFNSNKNAYQVCIDLLEDLEVTLNGVCRLTKGKVGPLIGAIAAMKDTPYFFKQDFNDMELLNYFNWHLNTDYKTFTRRGKLFESNYQDAKNFIRVNIIK